MFMQKPCTLVGREMYIEGGKQINTESRNNHLDLITNIGNELECSNFSVLAFPGQLDKTSCQKRRCFVLDSSNGLLLCSVSNYYHSYNRPLELYVCNPIIKQWIKIPNQNIVYSMSLGMGFTTQQLQVGLTNFKVIIALGQPHRFEIFSSETATWETHHVNILNPNIIRLGRHQYVEVVHKLGILHWMADKIRRVLAYDPSNRDWCSVINLPPRSNNNNNNQVIIDNVNMPITYKDINAFEESFRYMEMSRTPGQGYHLYIWTLKSYDNSGIWHLDHKIRLYDIRLYVTGFYKIGQFDSNKLYIWIYNSKELLTYDFQTQKLNNLRERNWLQLYDDDGLKFNDQCEALLLKLPVWPTTIKLGSDEDKGGLQ